MKLRAYAKINLTLDVTGRREDGYHTLDTVMQTVSVWDEVEIKKINKPGIRLFCNREYLPVDTKNTAFRAAQYFFERCGITGQGLSIHIRKYIPSRAGMGRSWWSWAPGWGRTCPSAWWAAPAAAGALGSRWSQCPLYRTAGWCCASPPRG